MRRIPQEQDALGCVDSWDSLLGANQIQGCFWEAVLGVMDRLVLSDAAWERMAPLIIGRPDQKGATGRDNRMFVERLSLARSSAGVWRLEQRVPALQPMEPQGGLAADLRGDVG